ncbi:MAG: hypothetical protein LJF04_10585 [Gemmatimonadetes bacterium]|nr:hypothetical protein [Gemmatimonadota bacterium]
MPRMTRVMAVMAALLLTLSWSGRAEAQGFGVGYTDIGPVIGLGGIGAASVSIGGRFETGIKALPEMGDGVLGIEASIDWWHYGNTLGDWSWFPISATANYHFRVEGGKIDPFLGLGLGFWIVSTPNCGAYGCGSYNSGVYFVGRAGVRYFFAPKAALYADLGAGASTLNVGVVFKMSGDS